ncbi:UDP-2,4-diacetamido-2,4,6-trideoxy-beta-L-altropyranose hydrolase [Psychrobacter sp. UBA3480]|uniref:UDP-2,4-diacetamido-2,4, 6-trideoxy-beta-L-altropyranose hydrolase n=1 Tax=Psychrobacter sp. UBA3480 TaxID=1947350 RepID=UPI0025DA542A|nr:UDP-2,4-diacetamido-2,4,6-trideoxy-beta-L-altropyranose hydrolase [Psychrobacter sp. UBA3480]
MKIGFRVDIAKHIGTGHLQRCLTLARELKKISISSIFFVREYDKELLSLIVISGFTYYIIGYAASEDISEEHLNWLGVSQEQDAQEFINAVTKQHIDMIVIDHYSIDSTWENIVKNAISLPIAVIDDLANRKHTCDLLIDQNYWPNLNSRYDDLVSGHCSRLLGPKYSLLRDEFVSLRESKAQKPSDELKTILVNFGGVGNMEVWKIFLPALVKYNKFKFHVITGKLPLEDLAYCKNMVKQSRHIFLEEQTDQMSSLMKVSDFALGACGSTVWERFCLGLNSALIDVADNQKDLVHYLHEKDLVDYLGSLNTITVDSIFSYLIRLSISNTKYLVRKHNIMNLVDGIGANRVVKELVLTYEKRC